ncbi:MAG TPA: YcxB family protein [Bacteroidales bacterium]|nr:YcxB family protein [Bacteroidales bacterium]
MDKIEKTIKYTPEDLQLAYTTHFRKMYPVRSRLLIVVSIISLLAGCLFIIYDLKKGSNIYANWAAWFLICYGVIIAILYFYNLRTVGKRMYSKMPDFERPFNYVFTDEKIQVASETINSDNKWEFYQSALISPEVIMVYPNKFRFNLFPKKYFTDQEYEMLKQWVRAKIKTKECK